MKSRIWYGITVSACAALIVGIGLGLILQNPISPATFCDKEEDCLREWVGALGSWAALPAAILSVAFLSKQIRRASNQHKKTVLLQTMREATHARLMRSHNARTLKHLDKLEAHSRAGDEPEFQALLDYMSRLGPDTFKASIHEYFEDEFGVVTNVSHKDVHTILVDLPVLRHGITASSYVGSPLAEKMDDIRTQANATNKAAISYLKAIRNLSADDH